jgi:hypothetical protein
LRRLLFELRAFDQLDPALLQLREQRVRLHRIELERFHDRIQLCRVHCATSLNALEQTLYLLELKDRLDLDRHGNVPISSSTPSARGSKEIAKS